LPYHFGLSKIAYAVERANLSAAIVERARDLSL